MTKNRKKSKKVSRKKNGRPSFWISMTRSSRLQVKFALAIIFCTLIISGVYTFLVAPHVLRWKGIYSDISHPDGYSIRGLDVSRYQGDIHWRRLRHGKIGKDPVSFVFIKATEGASLVDKQFERNFHEAREHGIIRGAYHYFIPSIPAEIQARNFLNNVDLEAGDLPPVLDIEVIGKLSPEELKRQALIWLHIMEEKYKAPPILYTYYSFKQKYLDSPEFQKYPYWIAHYYVDSLKYQGEWKFWQYTDRGTINGIKGDVDFNTFNGSMYSLQQLTIPE